jgi:hypothetical protein
VTGDVFEEDPFGAAFPDDAGDVGPEVAGIVGTTALSGRAEGLAGISGEDDVEGAAEGPGIEAAQIVPDRGRGEIPARWAAMRTARGQSSHSTKARV